MATPHIDYLAMVNEHRDALLSVLGSDTFNLFVLKLGEQPKPRTVKRVAATADPSDLTDAQLYAHFKATAPVEDVRFMLRTAVLSPKLRTQFEVLAESGLQRPAFYRRYRELQDAWRAESNERERDERTVEVAA